MKRFSALLLIVVLLLSISAAAFADSYTMNVSRNGKVVTDENGNRVNGRTQQKVYDEFYRLMKKVPVNFDRFDNMVFDITVDENEKVSIGKQVVHATNGSTLTSENASVCIFENQYSFHFTDNGETTLSLADFDGNIFETSAVTVKGGVAKNICSKCGQEQGNKFHVMSCGHFKCEVGEVGHGDGACGLPGHYACDGSNHAKCYNCLQPLCSGQHGEGICKHVHTWDVAFRMYSADNSKVIIRSYCPVCKAWFDTEPMDNPEYKAS